MNSASAGTAGTAGEFFAAMVESYDSLIRRAVPRYEEMTERLVHYLPAHATDVLELGCGTGNLSLSLARRYPGARFTFVDAADEMLQLTRARLRDIAPAVAERSGFRAARFEELTPAAGEFDLITSSISLHHIRDKGPVFRTLHRALRDAGRICFSDQMRADPPENHEKNWQAWLSFCRLPGNCTEEELASLVAHAEVHDHYESPGAHLRMLESAGFSDVDCLWRNGMWAIVSASA